MDEADSLCDRIAIIDYGQIKAMDSPSALKSALGGDTVDFSFSSGTEQEIADSVETIRGQSFVTSLRELDDGAYQAVVTNGEAAVPAVFDALASHQAHIGAISYERPSLDDVFLHYTGRELRVAGGGEEAIRARMVMRRTRG